MSPSPRPRMRAQLSRSSAAVGTAAVTAALTMSGMTVTPAVSSPAVAAAVGTDCPTAYPVHQLTAGQQVNGLTVASGTSPTGFTGSILGVIDSGIAPGLDMVVARLSSPEIDRVGGIWQGMSGSPVYTADGRLIGAVAYGLAFGPSPVAGITPYAEMQRMLSLSGSAPAARRTLDQAASADQVEIPGALARSITSSGVAARAEVGGGLQRLPLPLGVSGLAQGNRLARFARALDISGVRVHSAAAVDAATPTIPITAGSNLAASIAYGDVSAVSVGTATAVCDGKVLAFGHPMSFTGPSQMALHGASAIFVQEDPVAAPFKVANPSAPVGRVLQDRLSGLLAVQDPAAIPATTDVMSYVDVVGEWSRVGTTRINVPDAVPDIASFHLLADQDRVFDSIGGGSASVGWSIEGTRADGRSFRVVRDDVFASPFDVSFEPVFDLYDQLATIQFNEVEDVSIDGVDTTSNMSRVHTAYTIAKVQILAAGRWQRLATDQPLFVRGGQRRHFRVTLTSPRLGQRVERLTVVMPQRTGRKFGVIEIIGGNSVFPDGGEGAPGDEFSGPGLFDGLADQPETFDQLLRRIRRAPTNDLVMANLSLYRNNGTVIRRSARTRTGTVVNGAVYVEVQGIG